MNKPWIDKIDLELDEPKKIYRYAMQRAFIAGAAWALSNRPPVPQEVRDSTYFDVWDDFVEKTVKDNNSVQLELGALCIYYDEGLKPLYDCVADEFLAYVQKWRPSHHGISEDA